MMHQRPERLSVPPDPGKTIKASMRTTLRSTDNAALMKARIYGSVKPKSFDTNLPKDKPTKSTLLGLSPKEFGQLDKRQLGEIKDTLRPLKTPPKPKRKELSPSEKVAAQNKKKQQRMSHISDSCSSMDSTDISQEQMKDMWDTFSPHQKGQKKYEYLRTMFEPREQREQRPPSQPTVTRKVNIGYGW